MTIVLSTIGTFASWFLLQRATGIDPATAEVTDLDEREDFFWANTYRTAYKIFIVLVFVMALRIYLGEVIDSLSFSQSGASMLIPALFVTGGILPLAVAAWNWHEPLTD